MLNVNFPNTVKHALCLDTGLWLVCGFRRALEMISESSKTRLLPPGAVSRGRYTVWQRQKKGGLDLNKSLVLLSDDSFFKMVKVLVEVRSWASATAAPLVISRHDVVCSPSWIPSTSAVLLFCWCRRTDCGIIKCSTSCMQTHRYCWRDPLLANLT